MKIIITESQLKDIIQEETAAYNVAQQLSSVSDPNVILKTLFTVLQNGVIGFSSVPAILSAILGGDQESAEEKHGIFQALRRALGLNTTNNMENQETQQQSQEQPQEGTWQNNLGTWKTVANDAIATVYNAVPKQCNNDVIHTASMFKLNLRNVLSQKVVAMERTFMKELGVKYGDVVWVSGTGKWDGAWQIQDTMNKRFAGMHKIDLLVPSNIKTGKWNGVSISLPADDKTKITAKGTMKGSV